MKDTHYNNENGSVYKFCLEQDLNPYEFDLIKRIVRCRRKGQWLEDLEKTKVAIDLYIKEQRMYFEHPNLMKVKDALEELKRRLNIDTELKEMEEEFGPEIFVSEIKEILKPTGIELIDFLHDNKIDMQFDGDKLFAIRAEVYEALSRSTTIAREDAYGDNHFRCDNDRY